MIFTFPVPLFLTTFMLLKHYSSSLCVQAVLQLLLMLAVWPLHPWTFPGTQFKPGKFFKSYLMGKSNPWPPCQHISISATEPLWWPQVTALHLFLEHKHVTHEPSTALTWFPGTWKMPKKKSLRILPYLGETRILTFSWSYFQTSLFSSARTASTGRSARSSSVPGEAKHAAN